MSFASEYAEESSWPYLYTYLYLSSSRIDHSGIQMVCWESACPSCWASVQKFGSSAPWSSADRQCKYESEPADLKNGVMILPASGMWRHGLAARSSAVAVWEVRKRGHGCHCRKPGEKDIKKVGWKIPGCSGLTLIGRDAFISAESADQIFRRNCWLDLPGNAVWLLGWQTPVRHGILVRPLMNQSVVSLSVTIGRSLCLEDWYGTEALGNGRALEKGLESSGLSRYDGKHRNCWAIRRLL